MAAPTRSAQPSESYTEPVPAGIRQVGHDRVFWFRQRCNPDGTISIGRTASRNIRIRDDSVSKLHCLIHEDDGRYAMFDFQSTNGLKVSNKPPYKRFEKVPTVVLEVGMRIKLGDIQLVVVGPDGRAPLVAKRLSQFVRMALAVYGTVRAAARGIGWTRYKLGKLVSEGEGQGQGRGQGQGQESLDE